MIIYAIPNCWYAFTHISTLPTNAVLLTTAKTAASGISPQKLGSTPFQDRLTESCPSSPSPETYRTRASSSEISGKARRTHHNSYPPEKSVLATALEPTSPSSCFLPASTDNIYPSKRGTSADTESVRIYSGELCAGERGWGGGHWRSGTWFFGRLRRWNL